MTSSVSRISEGDCKTMAQNYVPTQRIVSASLRWWKSLHIKQIHNHCFAIVSIILSVGTDYWLCSRWSLWAPFLVQWQNSFIAIVQGL